MKTKQVIKVLKKNEYGNVGFIKESQYSQGYFDYSTTEDAEKGKQTTKFIEDCLRDSNIPYEIHEVTIHTTITRYFPEN